MDKSLTFNEQRKPWLYLLRGRRKPPFASLKRNLLYAPGVAGAILKSTEIDVLIIEQPIGFTVQDDEHAVSILDELKSWLITKEPVPLTFDDEPGRTYFAVVQNTLDDYEKMVSIRKGTIQFLCLDPFSYGEEISATFPSDAVTITNNGTEEADPIFEFEVLEPVTYLTVVSGEEYMLIGKPVPLGTAPAEERTRVFWSEADTLVGWSTPSSVENGIVSGTMSTDGYFFSPADYGAAQPNWHGPARKASLSETIQDFTLEVVLDSVLNHITHVGRIEVALLDANNVQVGKIMMWRPSVGTEENFAVQMAGNQSESHKIIDERGDKPSTWKEFRNGILRLTRIDNKWEAYLAVRDRDTGKHTRARYKAYLDVDRKYMNRIAQVQVYIAKSPQGPAMYMRVDDIKVYRWNTNLENQIPYIAHQGDIITLDHKNDEILINGEDRTDLKAFGANYFKLKPGENQVVIDPSDSFQTSAKYMERYR
ncbi:distal tail protein Dit [Sutcliffiella horikoshii]|uniref:distal tail protein Dit n=1 Tax=Sutcliffiella horikoshii TaxID=79883 RepID=UPI003CEDAC4C